MIYTITFNPSLDYIVRVKDFKTGTVNRTYEEKIFPGGKGINVSTVLSNLGIENKAFGFIAGFTGEEIEEKVKKSGCSADFIKLQDGISRINVKLKSNEESEINAQGPKITPQDIEKLYEKLDELKDGDLLVLAGSIPNTLPEDMYEKIISKLNHKNVNFIVDATCDLLLNVLKYKPFLIKPNKDELEEIFKVKIESEEELISYGRKLQEKGARNVLISMAGDGAILINENNEILKSKAPKGEVKNSVGAGDSMVAGFIAGYIKNNDYKEALKLGIATGSASAFSEDLATKEKIEEIFSGL
ncbi:1-phosphofructokinase [Clostridium baratii]|uniref:Tagatose-6-phosphate kinase n=1 Tax=Clostridium baratii TaxID=1561 RepID=A0A174TK89_9CLOT|nr:1-phosphofructokinase [Clostridium baratii]OPF52820.1 1-phosphofructokinase [Clostridium baratii]OPF56269.1 1-phosphofructokinase [Clostridium baratii]OPF58136.1 1-phosphofructokinase [Clostridium baratii]OPF59349.1 1-phosphofructokinase [Clostridium baratii]CUQ10504.1 1-phosphofructokinase [Clostridium baratii]